MASVGMVSVTDQSLQRGCGAFDVLRCYGGKPFRATAHLARLERNARVSELPLPPLLELDEAIRAAAAERPDGLIRLLVLRGGAQSFAPPTAWVLDEPTVAAPRNLRLASVAAPWHSAGESWGLTADGFGAVKWLSYGANVGSTRMAKKLGFDDALLYSRERLVLEGPRWCIGWFDRSDGAFCTPSLDLDILHSITRGAVLDAAAKLLWTVREGRWTVEELKAQASEVVAFSTGKHVLPVAAIDDIPFDVDGPRSAALMKAFMDIVEAETATDQPSDAHAHESRPTNLRVSESVAQSAVSEPLSHAT
jgi:branched-subunit amino acid aminotransferase/4-amino-4-deoxychorismate lyase